MTRTISCISFCSSFQLVVVAYSPKYYQTLLYLYFQLNACSIAVCGHGLSGRLNTEFVVLCNLFINAQGTFVTTTTIISSGL